MSKKVIVWGCGQMAEVAYFYLTYDSPYEGKHSNMSAYHKENRIAAGFQDIFL